MENSLVDVIAPVFFFLSFRLSPGFENVYVRFFATALWCGGIGREIEPPQLRISSYPSSWNKLVASTFGSLSNFSPTPTLTKDGTSMEREALLFFSLLVSALFCFVLFFLNRVYCCARVLWNCWFQVGLQVRVRLYIGVVSIYSTLGYLWKRIQFVSPSTHFFLVILLWLIDFLFLVWFGFFLPTCKC